MCLILFAYKTHPKYKLVVAANRDEFYDRPTAPADYWEDFPSILAGKDLEGKGTWMGVNKQGAVSMLTNYRNLSNLKPKAPTRGKLVSDFLITNQDPSGYLDTLDRLSNLYNDYNIILGTVDDLWYYSNVERKKYMLGSGIYGLSNRLLDSPWPKVEKGKEKLAQTLEKESFDEDLLFDNLFDDIKAPENKLPETGVGIEMEKMLSPMFIKSPKYGTRCSTVLLVDQDNQLQFSERTYNTTTFEYTTRSYSFAIK